MLFDNNTLTISLIATNSAVQSNEVYPPPSTPAVGFNVCKAADRGEVDPEKIIMNKRAPTKQARTELINVNLETPIMVRQVKHLNNIVEQDHRFFILQRDGTDLCAS